MERMLDVFYQDEMLSDIAFNRKVALMSEKAEKEEFIRKGIEVGKQQGMEETIRALIMKKYHQDASEWLQRCTQEQLEKILDAIINDISYETLLKKI